MTWVMLFQRRFGRFDTESTVYLLIYSPSARAPLNPSAPYDRKVLLRTWFLREYQLSWELR